MDKKFDGPFSLGFHSLQLHLKNLLQEAGGDEAASLLDALSSLPPLEQGVMLTMFQKVLARFQENSSLLPQSDSELKEFEESLYRDILQSMRQAAEANGSEAPRLEVLDGGKDKPSPSRTVSLADFKRSREAKARGLLN